MILNMLAGAKRIIAGSIRYHENSREHGLSYDRKDGKRVEIALTHAVNISGEGHLAPYLQICARRIHKNPGNALSEYVSLSMEEARLLKDLLNRPEVSAWLEEEA